MYNSETETPVNDAQASVLEEYMGIANTGGYGAGSGNMNATNGVGQGVSFFGQSPVRWFLFIGMVLVWLWLWGRLVKYLGGHD